jgi:drug/metabolite transporter (DMT)-like permease
MLAGIGLFGAMDAINKTLSEHHTVWQALTVRFITLLTLVFLLRLVRPGWGGSLASRHKRVHAARAVAMLCSAVCFYKAFTTLPLVEGYLVFFTSPFFVMAMAATWLREAPRPAAWAWVAVGFGGVAIGLAPGLAGGLGGAAIGYAWAFAGTLCYSSVLVLNRQLRGDPGLISVLVWPAALGLVAVLPAGVSGWTAPTPLTWTLMLANGMLVGVATGALALAFRHATASRLAPFSYSGMVWSLFYDYAIWGHLPGWSMVVGAAVVVFACAMSERANQKPGGKSWVPSARSDKGVADSTAERGNGP